MSQTLEPQVTVPKAKAPLTKAPKAREGGRTPGWLYAVMAAGLVLVVIPFIWMVVSSFKPEQEVRAVPPTWWPETVTMENYRQLFTQLDFPTYFMNSAIVAVAVAVGNMVFCSMLGYALAKLDFPGKKIVFGLVLGTLMVPGVVVATIAIPLLYGMAELMPMTVMVSTA
mgnify:CR=1 FL=1